MTSSTQALSQDPRRLFSFFPHHHPHRRWPCPPGAFIVALMLLLSCGDKLPAEEIQPPEEDMAAQAFARSFCANAYECTCSPGGEDPQTCETTIEPVFRAWQEEALRNGLMYDAECLAQHIKTSADDPCATKPQYAADCLIYRDDTSDSWAACSNIDPQGLMADCREDFHCDRTIGICVPNSYIAPERELSVGEGCLDEAGIPQGDCSADDDLFCEIDGVVATCQPKLSLQQLCTRDPECNGDSYCDDNDQKCAPRALPGQPCQRNSICVSGICSDGECTDTLDIRDACTPLLRL